MKIETKRLRHNPRDTSDASRKRKDIDPKKLYLVKYDDIWLFGRFSMEWYGWNFQPNLGVMSMQIESLWEIHEVVSGLRQWKSGSTAAHITSYLEKQPIAPEADEDHKADEDHAPDSALRLYDGKDYD